MFVDELDDEEREVEVARSENLPPYDCPGCGGVIYERVCPGCGYHEAEEEE